MTEPLKWEYIVETFGGAIRGVKPEEMQVGLNNLGEQGWEIVAVHQLQGSNRFWVVAKRPLSVAVSKQRIREKRGW